MESKSVLKREAVQKGQPMPQDTTVSESPSVTGYVPGATVRQYHHTDLFDDAIIIAVHSNGGLDVEIDGIRYGWSVNTCKVLGT